jgi:hypothetical protein
MMVRRYPRLNWVTYCMETVAQKNDSRRRYLHMNVLGQFFEGVLFQDLITRYIHETRLLYRSCKFH